ncbi:hypothetical protein HEP_00340500 [Hepatocystis sp. ex Piliocolobus tephrosceles]|nr:hypothetical protein HEP_00340500 [Hepatocystis sp. ex Piliocolobus tephrosceles]
MKILQIIFFGTFLLFISELVKCEPFIESDLLQNIILDIDKASNLNDDIVKKNIKKNIAYTFLAIGGLLALGGLLGSSATFLLNQKKKNKINDFTIINNDLSSLDMDTSLVEDAIEFSENPSISSNYESASES